MSPKKIYRGKTIIWNNAPNLEHQGNANENNEICLHTYENAQNPEHWQHQMLRGRGTIQTPIHCWWGCKIVQPLWRTAWQFLMNLNILLPYNSAIMFFGIHPKELKRMSTNNLHTDAYSSFIHNCYNLEVIKMSFSRWMDKLTIVHPDKYY